LLKRNLRIIALYKLAFSCRVVVRGVPYKLGHGVFIRNFKKKPEMGVWVSPEMFFTPKRLILK